MKPICDNAHYLRLLTREQVQALLTLPSGAGPDGKPVILRLNPYWQARAEEQYIYLDPILETP